MPKSPRLKYEKPVSIDLGRVAPILGDTCSIGNGAADCPAGMNNAVVAICEPSGAGADNDCRTGSNAGTFCWPTGSGAAVYCLAGSGFGSMGATEQSIGGTEPGRDSATPTSTLGGTTEPVLDNTLGAGDGLTSPDNIGAEDLGSTPSDFGTTTIDTGPSPEDFQ